MAQPYPKLTLTNELVFKRVSTSNGGLFTFFVKKGSSFKVVHPEFQFEDLLSFARRLVRDKWVSENIPNMYIPIRLDSSMSDLVKSRVKKSVEQRRRKYNWPQLPADERMSFKNLVEKQQDFKIGSIRLYSNSHKETISMIDDTGQPPRFDAHFAIHLANKILHDELTRERFPDLFIPCAPIYHPDVISDTEADIERIKRLGFHGSIGEDEVTPEDEYSESARLLYLLSEMRVLSLDSFDPSVKKRLSPLQKMSITLSKILESDGVKPASPDALSNIDPEDLVLKIEIEVEKIKQKLVADYEKLDASYHAKSGELRRLKTLARQAEDNNLEASVKLEAAETLKKEAEEISEIFDKRQQELDEWENSLNARNEQLASRMKAVGSSSKKKAKAGKGKG